MIRDPPIGTRNLPKILNNSEIEFPDHESHIASATFFNLFSDFYTRHASISFDARYCGKLDPSG